MRFYTVLDCMIGSKLVSRHKGGPIPERGRKARYFYKITGSGRAVVNDAQKARPRPSCHLTRIVKVTDVQPTMLAMSA